MKFNIFLAVFLLSCTLNAQIKKGSVLLGGQAFYRSNTYGFSDLSQENKTGTFSISAGKAFKENKVFGINISYSPTRQYNNYNGVDTSNWIANQYNFGLFFRAYKQIAKDFYFFSQLDGAFITSNQTQSFALASRDTKSTQRGVSISFTPGVSYQLFKKIQFEVVMPDILSIRYLTTKPSHSIIQGRATKQEDFAFSSNFSNNISLSYFGAGFRFML